MAGPPLMAMIRADLMGPRAGPSVQFDLERIDVFQTVIDSSGFSDRAVEAARGPFFGRGSPLKFVFGGLRYQISGGGGEAA